MKSNPKNKLAYFYSEEFERAWGYNAEFQWISPYYYSLSKKGKDSFDDAVILSLDSGLGNWDKWKALIICGELKIIKARNRLISMKDEIKERGALEVFSYLKERRQDEKVDWNKLMVDRVQLAIDQIDGIKGPIWSRGVQTRGNWGVALLIISVVIWILESSYPKLVKFLSFSDAIIFFAVEISLVAVALYVIVMARGFIKNLSYWAAIIALSLSSMKLLVIIFIIIDRLK